MRQLAWLRSIPKDAKKSRLQDYLDYDLEPPLPEIGDGQYLVNLMDELGGATQTGMGISPCSWQEILAWLTLTGLSLTAWECSMVKQLSASYVQQLGESSEAGSVSPYTPENIEGIGTKVISVLRAYSKSTPPIDEE